METSFANFLDSPIPLKVWQTYKTKELPYFAQETQQTWIDLNPEFSYQLWDDQDIENYLVEKWGEEYLAFFQALPIGAMKADLWRYLILCTEGGVYSDIDSVCLMPVKNWPLETKSSNKHVLYLDLDLDESQFCQWTFACTPKHPMMQYVCHYILEKWKNQGFSYQEDGTIDVLNTTGPKIFSEAIKKYLKASSTTPAAKLRKIYDKNQRYQKDVNLFGLFFTPKGFFSGEGTKNLFWGSSQTYKDAYCSWAYEASKELH